MINLNTAFFASAASTTERPEPDGDFVALLARIADHGAGTSQEDGDVPVTAVPDAAGDRTSADDEAVPVLLAEQGDAEVEGGEATGTALWVLHTALRADAPGHSDLPTDGDAPTDGDVPEVLPGPVALEESATDEGDPVDAAAALAAVLGVDDALGETGGEEATLGGLLGADGQPVALASSGEGEPVVDGDDVVARVPAPTGEGEAVEGEPVVDGDDVVARVPAPAGEGEAVEEVEAAVRAALLGRQAQGVEDDGGEDAEAESVTRTPGQTLRMPTGDQGATEETVTLDGEADADQLRSRAPRAAETATATRPEARAAVPTGERPTAEPVMATQAEATAVRAAGEVVESTTTRSPGATMVERILEAATRLENQPPPRQLTLELGEARVRLSIEDGALRLQLLGEERLEDRALLRAATSELRSRGFDLGADAQGREQAGHDASGDPSPASRDGRTRPPRPTAGAQRTSTDLRL